MQRSIWPLRHSSISRPDHSKPSNSAPHHRVGVATEMGGSVGTKRLDGYGTNSFRRRKEKTEGERENSRSKIPRDMCDASSITHTHTHNMSYTLPCKAERVVGGFKNE